MRRFNQTFDFNNYSHFNRSTQQQQQQQFSFQQQPFSFSNFNSENIFSSSRRRIDNAEIQRHEEAENYLEHNVIIVSFASFIVCFIENGVAYFGYEAINILLNQVKRNVSLRKIIENGNNRRFHDHISIPFYVPQNGYNFEYESKQYGAFQYFNFGQCAKLGNNGNQIVYVGSKEFLELLTSWFYKNIISTEAGELIKILDENYSQMINFYKSAIPEMNRGNIEAIMKIQNELFNNFQNEHLFLKSNYNRQFRLLYGNPRVPAIGRIDERLYSLAEQYTNNIKQSNDSNQESQINGPNEFFDETS